MFNRIGVRFYSDLKQKNILGQSSIYNFKTALYCFYYLYSQSASKPAIFITPNYELNISSCLLI